MSSSPPLLLHFPSYPPSSTLPPPPLPPSPPPPFKLSRHMHPPLSHVIPHNRPRLGVRLDPSHCPLPHIYIGNDHVHHLITREGGGERLLLRFALGDPVFDEAAVVGVAVWRGEGGREGGRG